MKDISNDKIPFFQHFLCGIDWKLNRILKDCMKYGISKYIDNNGNSGLFAEVEFEGGNRYEFWNCEKWDGWLKFGSFRNIFGKEFYVYANKRPTRRTMNRFLNELKKVGYGNNQAW